MTYSFENLATPAAANFEAQQLDPSDPIDRLVFNYAQAIEDDAVPALAVQSKLAARAQAGEELATRLLVRSHLGLVATVIYPHKESGLARQDLLQLGINSLVIAAKTYSIRADLDFNDHAVKTVEAAVVEAVPLAKPQFSSMDDVLSFLHKVPTRTASDADKSRSVIEQPSPIRRQETGNYLLDEFTPRDLRVLQQIFLPYKKAAQQMGITKDTVKMIARSAQQKTDTSNATQLVLALQQSGMQFDVRKPKKPLVETLDVEEMKIARMIEQPYDYIADKLGISKDLKSKVAGMKKRTGARSRAELALMVRFFDTGERRKTATLPREKLAAKLGLQTLEGCNVELLLEQATPKQREMVEAYYLVDEPASWAGICVKYGIKRAAAMQAANRGIKAMSRALTNTS